MFSSDFPPALLIPILALMIPIVAIVAHSVSKISRDRERHATIRELARAGQSIPPELLAEGPDGEWPRSKRDAADPNRILIPAVINIATGIGLTGMFLAMMPGTWLWSIGLIPEFLGLGLLLIWHVQRKQLASTARPQ